MLNLSEKTKLFTLFVNLMLYSAVSAVRGYGVGKLSKKLPE